MTTNLAVALQALRRPDAIRLLWIDAICINQSSRAERAQEVRCMGATYRAAARVTIWLGQDAQPGDWPLRLDRHTSELTHIILNKLADCGSSDRDYDAAAGVLHATGDMNLAVLLLLRFFSCPWWLRIWVLQELAFAKTTIVVYGSGTISWDRLTEAADALRRLSVGGNSYLFKLSRAERAHIAQSCRIRVQRDDGPSRGVQSEVAHLLWQTRFSRCTEPGDRLFGILGMVKGGVSGEKLLEIDYAKPATDVFRDLSVFMSKNRLLSQVLCSVTEPVEGWSILVHKYTGLEHILDQFWAHSARVQHAVAQITEMVIRQSKGESA